MRLRYRYMLWSLLCLLPGVVEAAGNASRGARAFAACAGCHSVEPGRHLTGPSLAKVWGRRAASAEGFTRYSDALQHAEIAWNSESLDKWLSAPEALVPGTAMAVPGVQDAGVRADLIAYLEAVAKGQAPALGGTGGGMMGSSAPANLKDAGPGSLVVSVRHCGDTYVVTTATGEKHKLWEFNVRLKTDSSRDGPSPEKPVMIGSGMRGDRVSIVFVSPQELGQFIKESCD